ncbi:MAG: BrnT family toxin [Candidatus Omnitrophica bacterium]|nr:BrnT family toxin [Candidatus Omnitrophota bacterium]
MILDWNDAKNNRLEEERGIRFEEIAIALENNGLIDLIDHPNHNKYPHQKLMIVCWRNYIYIVPCVKTTEGYFLKTIIPSRKATKNYFNPGGNYEKL